MKSKGDLPHVPLEKLSIVVLFNQYNSDAGFEGINKFKSLLDTLHNCIVQYIVIDNYNECSPEYKLCNDVTVIGGDNSCREFSGLARAIGYLKSNGARFDCAILTNDTFSSNAAEFDPWISDRVVRFVHQRQLSAGILGDRNRWGEVMKYVAYSPRRFALNGLSFNHWVRSNFVIIPYDALAGMEYHPLQRGDFFPPDYTDAIYRPGSPVSGSLRDYIRNYLCPVAPYDANYVWHSHFKLNEGTYERFTFKAMAILNEMHLAQLLRDAGVPVIDLRIAALLVKLHARSRRFADRTIRQVRSRLSVQPYLLYHLKRMLKHFPQRWFQ